MHMFADLHFRFEGSNHDEFDLFQKNTLVRSGVEVINRRSSGGHAPRKLGRLV